MDIEKKRQRSQSAKCIITLGMLTNAGPLVSLGVDFSTVHSSVFLDKRKNYEERSGVLRS